MVKFLHIFIKPKAEVTEDSVRDQMNLAVDWYKYAENCWIVKTTSEIDTWQIRLKPLVESTGVLLILTLDPTKRQGWIAKGFWEWLQKSIAIPGRVSQLKAAASPVAPAGKTLPKPPVSR